MPYLDQIFQFDLEFKKFKLHEICSYIAMYPPKLVHRLVEAFSHEGDSIYDPFSGRGTTLLEARLMNRKAYASDLSPLAFVLTKAKAEKISKQKVIKRIDELKDEYKTSKITINKKDQEYMKTYFSFDIYKQVIFIKQKLGKKWESLDKIDNFILTCCLGILHGPSKKDGNSSYLSISMSNTNSMSKQYVDRYVAQHQIKFPLDNDLFEKLTAKVEKTLWNNDLYDYDQAPIGKVKQGDATKCQEIFRNKKFDLILTSPPYLNVFNYTRENWIRMWLLGLEKDKLSEIRLDDSHSYEPYKQFLTKFMHAADKVLKKDGKLILIIGDVEHKYKFIDLWEEIKEKTLFDLVDHHLDHRANNKSTRKNGTRAGKATKVDNICVFERRK